MLYEGGLYYVTDRKLSKKSDVDTAKDALEGGVGIIQYREKDLPTKIMLDVANQLRKLTSDYSAKFIINDRIDVALACNADGVHLGQDDMPLDAARNLLPGKIIGVTVHNVPEATTAADGGADYLGVSPIYSTDTKSDAGKPAGLRLITDVGKVCNLPRVAIGGINGSNLDDVLSTGVESVAMISAIVTKDDVAGTVKSLLKRIQGR